ncbi:hypothetical protein NLM16_08955 [Bradyrhizobium brasilense]|uniref:hypothetical protein n=1 Tax=Bradyrhizobium brasilense TaxID=1419277 RepID=UPI0028778FED|nr:hypothetical protein [Bradyrhizobium brasilense]MCP3414227.1 hypothetical protein [Bradyrhizobium brasilense]
MDTPFSQDVAWITQRHGQDWRDESTLAAIDWLTSLVPLDEWGRRVTATDARFQAAKSEWALGRRVPLFDPADAIAWYIHQARCYADPTYRPDFFEPEGYRIAPVFRRLGQLLPTLKAIDGAEDRGARLMTDGKSRPDDGIFEFLVAGAYLRRGWERVAFVPETPGIEQRPDLYVDRGKSHWAVECKRAGRSGYARDERIAGERMATRAHEISRTARRPLVVMVRFNAELTSLPEGYLAEKVSRFADNTGPYEWDDEGSTGVVFDVIWRPLLQILQTDDIYFGSSRMLQLLLGRYEPFMDFTLDGEWIPADGRPFHATSVSHVSVVTWTSMSAEAARRKAQHFRGVVGRASTQLPGDRPGAIHVGYEAVGGNSVDGLRHRLNAEQMRTFDARGSKLSWVYGNYFMPEHVTARNESAAVSESTAWYRAGASRAKQPLPGHLLFVDDDGKPGSHFTR